MTNSFTDRCIRVKGLIGTLHDDTVELAKGTRGDSNERKRLLRACKLLSEAEYEITLAGAGV